MDVSKFFIEPDVCIREAISKLDQTAKKLLIVTKDNKMMGVITDGDIRRWILKNGDLTEQAFQIMNTSPIYLLEEEKGRAYELMRLYSVEGIPIVNERLEVVEVIFWNDEERKEKRNKKVQNIPVVIMAGGKGSRLYPYTNVIPKPLIPIGDIPIIERIMKQFQNYGFDEFYLTMNYKKDMIKAYFNESLSYHLTFLEEKTPHGTAASLKLLEERITGSFFVSNCDILLDLNYENLLDYHKENKNKLTLVTALKSYEIPYGVAELGKNGSVISLSEKPKLELLVNTGLYILDSELLSHIPKGKNYDMTDLIQDCLLREEKVGAYPVMDSTWLDMGEWTELKRMEKRLNL